MESKGRLQKRLLNIIATNNNIKENLTFREHLQLYNTASKLTLQEIATLIRELTPPKTNPRAESIIKSGLAVASLAIPLPGLTLAIFYLVDINRYKCASRVEKEGGERKVVGFAQCRLAASKWAVQYVKKELAKCKSTRKPKKCQKKMYKLLNSVSQKAVKDAGKLRWAIAKARERERRARAKIG
jgi:hypothetical protein